MLKPWILIEDPLQSGTENMARDRQLYQDFQLEEHPILRFYQWDKPTLSIGRFQKVEPELLTTLQTLDIPLVQRPTGGQAILHQGDFTFSVIGAVSAGMKKGVLDTYCEVAKAILKGLQLVDIDASLESIQHKYRQETHCFGVTTPADIQVQGKKIVGSAQVRSRKAFLQQSVIYLAPDPEMMAKVFGPEFGVNLFDLNKFNPDLNSEQLKQALIQGFQNISSVNLNFS